MPARDVTGGGGYGSAVPTGSTAPSVAEVLARSDFHPGAPPVTVCETHTAWVFLAGDRAYKMKQPVKLAFLDFSTLALRRAACTEEVRVNAELAPTLGMRLRAVVAAGDSYELAEPDAADAVEYVIAMRRFDEEQTMAALVERGALTAEQVSAVARRLVAFHAVARICRRDDHAGDVRRACEANLRELLELVRDDALVRSVQAAQRFAGAFVQAQHAMFTARAADGRIRDGHGDLRAEHVVLEDPLAIVDRLEFDARLRQIDVADDLAFLLMDLESLGAGDAARSLVEAYRAAGGEPGTPQLLAFYGNYRALVRAKVALLRAAAHSAASAACVDRARVLLALAERFAWRARAPFVLAIGGPPASGKSTLAEELARRSGWPVLSSDALRKERGGLALDDAAPASEYTPEARAGVYRALGSRARDLVRDGCGVVVDATFGDGRLRAAFLEAFDRAGPLRAVECTAPAAVLERRARSRRLSDARGSDAGAATAARLAASFSGWAELPEPAILRVRGETDPGVLVDEIADWIDAHAG